MIIRTSPVKGAKATYSEVRGPDGERYAKWCEDWGERWKERYGLDVGGSKAEVTVHRNRMRNARKRERQVSEVTLWDLFRKRITAKYGPAGGGAR